MAAFIAKQMVGKQLGSVKGALGDKEEKEDKKDGSDDDDDEIAEAKREAEEKRKEKYRKMEEERETLRQSIRDKAVLEFYQYGIKKKIPQDPLQDPGLEGRLGRKKKTPEELAAEASIDASDTPAHNSIFPKTLDDLTSKVTDLPGKVIGAVSGVTDRCCLQ